MNLACNVPRQVGLLVELVNLVTPGRRGGAQAVRLDGAELVEAFAALLAEGAALRAVPDADVRLVSLARELRGALVAEDRAETAARINALIRRYGALPYLAEDVGQPFHLHFHGADSTNVVEALGGEFATTLALVVDGYGEGRFGMCQAHDCEAVYVDLTRNGSRRYCSAACTARAKTAAYRSRRGQKETAPPA